MQKQLIASFLAAVVVLFSQGTTVSSNAVVGCYFATNANARSGDGAFHVGQINPNLCTHLYYGFLSVGDNGQVISVNKQTDYLYSKTYGIISDTIKLKKVNKNLKVLLSIGGSSVPSDLFSSMAASAEKRGLFVRSVVNVLDWHNFDGVDINWQYPSQSDAQNYVQLLADLKGALKEKQKLLTVTVAATPYVNLQTTPFYKPLSIESHCDLINVMSYDFASASDAFANLNAPLKGVGTKTVNHSISAWTDGDLNSKITLGLPFYGRTYTLKNSGNNKPGASVTGPGQPGPYRQEAGVLGFNEICVNLQNGWQRGWDATHLAPYASKGDQWVSYDDDESLSYKIEFIKYQKLAGAYIYSIDSDDFLGKCGEKFPLLTKVYQGLTGTSTVLDFFKNIFQG